MLSWIHKLFKPKKLCKHDWEFIDKEKKYHYNGFEEETYYLYIYQCPLCLKVKKDIRYW